MKKIIILIVSILLHFNLISQNEALDTNQYAVKAIKHAIIQYHQQKSIGYYKNMVITIKIMRINKISGEFVLNYILNGFNYDGLQPTHYLYVNLEPILIILDATCKEDLTKYGINEITGIIKNNVLKLLSDSNSIISSQSHPYMIFNYNEFSLNGKFYLSYPPPEKYRFNY